MRNFSWRVDFRDIQQLMWLCSLLFEHYLEGRAFTVCVEGEFHTILQELCELYMRSMLLPPTRGIPGNLENQKLIYAISNSSRLDA